MYDERLVSAVDEPEDAQDDNGEHPPRGVFFLLSVPGTRRPGTRRRFLRIAVPPVAIGALVRGIRMTARTSAAHGHGISPSAKVLTGEPALKIPYG